MEWSSILAGVLIAVVSGLIILFFKRSRLKVKATAHKVWFMDDVYYPNIVAQITNVGFDKTEISDAHLELKKGSSNLVITDVLHYNRIEALAAKTTTVYKLNCSEAMKKHPFNDYSLIRVKVLTTNDKTYTSNWLSINDALSTWS